MSESCGIPLRLGACCDGFWECDGILGVGLLQARHLPTGQHDHGLAKGKSKPKPQFHFPQVSLPCLADLILSPDLSTVFGCYACFIFCWYRMIPPIFGPWLHWLAEKMTAHRMLYLLEFVKSLSSWCHFTCLSLSCQVGVRAQVSVRFIFGKNTSRIF